MTIMNMVGGGGGAVSIDNTLTIPYDGTQSGTATVYFSATASAEGRTSCDMVLNGKIFSGSSFYERVNGSLTSTSTGLSNVKWNSINGVAYGTAISADDTTCSIVKVDGTMTFDSFPLTMVESAYAFMVGENEVEVFYADSDKKQRFTKAGDSWQGGVLTDGAIGIPYAGGGYSSSNGFVIISSGRTKYVYDASTDSVTKSSSARSRDVYNYEGYTVETSRYTSSSSSGVATFTLYDGDTEIFTEDKTTVGSNITTDEIAWSLSIGNGMIFTGDSIFDIATGTTYTTELSGSSTTTFADLLLLKDNISVTGDRCRKAVVNAKASSSAVVVGSDCYIFVTS